MEPLKRLNQLHKMGFDKKYHERKNKLFKRAFRHKIPYVNIKLLDDEAGKIIKKHFPDWID